MTKDEALRLALEALEDLGNHDRICPQWPTYAEPENYPKCNCGYDQAITAIKAALEAKDEPVDFEAIIDDIEAIDCRYRGDPSYDRDAYWMRNEVVATVKRHASFYTTPPQRKPLTDEEIWACLPKDPDEMVFARAIEAKLKEKNNG
jgi:hypothetical protein